MLELLAAALLAGAGYWIHLRLYPRKRCGLCSGSGKRPGSTSQRFGTCPRCEGKGELPRIGARR